ncbi:MAG: ATP-binding protein [Coriobacteriales bacterium]|jgi:predicted AAA+ superfamily ATPase|nr:ATP-binding protein [Coriobacteriales bacterium]
MKRKIDKKLSEWKAAADRKPLIVDGARQVGKTYALTKFAKEHYENYVHVNLDLNGRIQSSIQEDISPASIIRIVEAETHKRVIPHKTLLIFDEVQASERALASLKYFYEDAPEYHVAAAGSLFGVAVNRERYSFPVGRVSTVHMYPMDFEEYLVARDEAFLCDEIKESYAKGQSLPAILHARAIDLYHEYLICGGMPACVAARAKEASLLDIPTLQAEIVNNYIADMAKYASATETVKIRACYDSIPAQLAKDNKKFQYKVVRKGGSAGIFGASIEWLRLAGIVLRCQNIEQGYIPLSAYVDFAAFKLYMSDVGLLTMKTALPHSIILMSAENTFMGAVTENYIAQQLTAMGQDLYYWTSAGRAELDFVIQSREKLTAIEVKRGLHTKGKSLRMFQSKYAPDECVRLSLKNFGIQGGIRAVPLYAVFCLEL